MINKSASKHKENVLIEKGDICERRMDGVNEKKTSTYPEKPLAEL